MRILVLETERHGADGVITELQDAGHHVLRCHGADAPAFPCNALFDGGLCPLDQEPGIDVVVDHRSHAYTRPTPYEDGVSCSVRQHVPLVSSGVSVFSPFDGFITRVADRGEIVAACEAAAAAPIERLSAPARAKVREVLAGEPGGDRADVIVQRRGSHLWAEVVLPAEVGEREGEVAVKVAGVLRAHDREASKLDVSVRREG